MPAWPPEYKESREAAVFRKALLEDARLRGGTKWSERALGWAAKEWNREHLSGPKLTASTVDMLRKEHRRRGRKP